MPMTAATPVPLEIDFQPSVAAELLFLTRALSARDHPGRFGRPGEPATEVPPDLEEAITTFWEDDVAFWELFVVANEAGALVGPLRSDELETRLGPACDTMPLEPALRSESPDDQVVVRARLERLARDKRLRRRYLRMLARLWGCFEGEWEARRLAAIRKTAEACAERAARDAAWQGLLQGAETASQIIEAGWERARESGTATVAVCAYGGSLVLDLPGVQFFALSLPLRAPTDRDRAAEVARRLRAVADPTRLSLLELLSREPRTVGELATELDLAQPTVSNHMKLLRDAGLVRGGDASGPRRGLVVDHEALASLFEETKALLRPGG